MDGRLPASSRPASGTTTSRTRALPMRSVTGCFTRPIDLRYRDRPAERRPAQTHDLTASVAVAPFTMPPIWVFTMERSGPFTMAEIRNHKAHDGDDGGFVHMLVSL